MSCKYNNSMYTIEPEEVDVCFDEFEQLLLSEDYESQENIEESKVLEIIGELQDDEYYRVDDEYHDLDDGGIIMGEVQDLSHNIGSMSIYEKLARIQEEVMNTSFSKSGENKFQKYDYFELEDLLQKIIPLTIKYETTIMFSFTSDGVLKLKDWDPEKGEVSIRVPFPELEAINRGTNKIQSTGAYITYLKRYLLMNMFLIMEKDIVDSNTNNAGVKKETNTSKKEVDVDEVLNKIKAHIHKKDSTIPITPVRINLTRRNMLKKKEIDEVESKAVFEWFKKQEKEAKQ